MLNGRSGRRWLLAVVWALAAARPAHALKGELCFPMEGWAFVSHWHVGSAARSVREGWLNRTYNDRSWARIKAGTWLPRSTSGVWIRQFFQYRQHLWKDFIMAPIDLPPGTQMFVNGKEVDVLPTAADLSLGAYLRKGTNFLILVYPPLEENTVKVPEIALRAISRTGGKSRSLGSLTTWRVRRERIESQIPVDWLKNPFTSNWKTTVAHPLTTRDNWLPDAPYCLKALLDVPHFWRKRNLAVFFHEIPGSPAVYLNGVQLAEKLSTPARIELKGHMKFNGRDTLALVYPSLPEPNGRAFGQWGIAAVRCYAPGSSSIPLPQFRSGATLLFKPGFGADQEGARQALRYVSQALKVSATHFELSWAETEDEIASGAVYGPMLAPADREVHGLVAAVWSTSPFGEADRQAALLAARARCQQFRSTASGQFWLVSPPTAGSKLGATNTRLQVYNRELGRAADACGAKIIPLYDVCRSALKARGKWPARPKLSDLTGQLTAFGSYLMALAILDAFAMP